MNKKKENIAKKPIGCRKKNLDRKQINKYIDQQLSVRAIAEIVGVDHQTIHNRFSTKLKKRKEEAIIDRVKKRKQLKKAQWKAAIKDKNPTMLIWLGKNELGQTDKLETTEKKEHIEIDFTPKKKK